MEPVVPPLPGGGEGCEDAGSSTAVVGGSCVRDHPKPEGSPARSGGEGAPFLLRCRLLRPSRVFPLVSPPLPRSISSVHPHSCISSCAPPLLVSVRLDPSPFRPPEGVPPPSTPSPPHDTWLTWWSNCDKSGLSLRSSLRTLSRDSRRCRSRAPSDGNRDSNVCRSRSRPLGGRRGCYLGVHGPT